MIHPLQYLLGLLAMSSALLIAQRCKADEPARTPTPVLSFTEFLAEGKEQEAQLPQPQLASAIQPGDEQPIDLFAALQLAEAQNPDIGLARQAIQEALAVQMQARSLLLPSLRAGGNYHEHQGILQKSDGTMADVNTSSLYLGNGAMAVAAGSTVIPGVQIYAHLGDGLLEPLAARQLVTSRNFQAQAASNNVLLDVAGRFLELVDAESELQALQASEIDTAKVVKITRAFLNANQGRQSDHERALTTSLLLHAQTVQAEEHLLAAAAELSRVLSLDPTVRLRAAPQQGALLELVDARLSLEELLAVAQRSRPELAGLDAEIARKRTMVRQERIRPFLPTVSLGFSAGDFGGGTSPAFGSFGGRTDVDLMAYWTLKNMGFGNRALAKERQSEQRQTVLQREQMMNVINREVADAQALVLSRRQDLAIAGERWTTAESAFNEDLARIQGLEGLPIELLNSLNRLTAARVDVVRVVYQYNLAQMQLFVALGQTPLAASPSARGR